MAVKNKEVEWSVLLFEDQFFYVKLFYMQVCIDIFKMTRVDKLLLYRHIFKSYIFFSFENSRHHTFENLV